MKKEELNNKEQKDIQAGWKPRIKLRPYEHDKCCGDSINYKHNQNNE